MDQGTCGGNSAINGGKSYKVISKSVQQLSQLNKLKEETNIKLFIFCYNRVKVKILQ